MFPESNGIVARKRGSARVVPVDVYTHFICVWPGRGSGDARRRQRVIPWTTSGGICSWLLPGFLPLTFSLSILAGSGQGEARHGGGMAVSNLDLCNLPCPPPPLPFSPSPHPPLLSPCSSKVQTSCLLSCMRLCGKCGMTQMHCFHAKAEGMGAEAVRPPVCMEQHQKGG